MDTEVIIGVVAVVISVLAAVGVWFGVEHTTSAQFRRDTTLMAFAAIMTVAAVVPQLVKNYQLGDKMHESVSPFFPAFYPLIILAKFPAECDMLAAATKEGARITITMVIISHYFTLLCFIAWVFQYAGSDTANGIKWSLYTAGTVYTLAAVAASTIIYAVITPTTRYGAVAQTDDDDGDGDSTTEVTSFM